MRAACKNHVWPRRTKHEACTWHRKAHHAEVWECPLIHSLSCVACRSLLSLVNMLLRRGHVHRRCATRRGVSYSQLCPRTPPPLNPHGHNVHAIKHVKKCGLFFVQLFAVVWLSKRSTSPINYLSSCLVMREGLVGQVSQNAS